MSSRSAKKGDPVAGALAAAAASDSRNRNLQTFPALRTIMFVGFTALVMCLSLLYLVDPHLTTEYAGQAADMFSDIKDLLLNAEDMDDDSTLEQRLVNASISTKQLVLNAFAADKASEANYSGFNPAITKYKEGHVVLADFDFIWKRPSPSVAAAGLVLLLNTCGRSAHTWFAKSPSCPDCVNMPAQNAISSSLVREGFAVVALSPVSSANTTQCWTLRDRKYVVSALKYAYNAMAPATTKTLPLYALAHENGALFVSTNARVMGNRFGLEFSALCLMNVGIGAAGEADYFPPTVYIDMERNTKSVERNRAVVQQKTVSISSSSSGSDAMQLVSKPRKMSESYFVPALLESQSKALFAGLIKGGFIGAQNNTLIRDPMKFKNHQLLVQIGKQAAPRVIPARDPLRGPASGVLQLLNLAWGFKEINDEFMPQVIDFFKKHRKNAVPLVAKPKPAPKPAPTAANASKPVPAAATATNAKAAPAIKSKPSPSNAKSAKTSETSPTVAAKSTPAVKKPAPKRFFR